MYLITYRQRTRSNWKTKSDQQLNSFSRAYDFRIKNKKKREDKENRQRKEKEKACLALKTQTLPVLLVVRKGNTTGLHPPKNNSNNNKCVHERLWKKGGKTPTSQMERRQNARAYKKKKTQRASLSRTARFMHFFFSPASCIGTPSAGRMGEHCGKRSRLKKKIEKAATTSRKKKKKEKRCRKRA